MKLSHPLVRRLVISCVIGFGLAWIISEGGYYLLNDGTRREPQTIELVIPPGTAEQVAAGQSVQSLPQEMLFVAGDVLVVKNEDVTDHQLGPVWVPSGATSRLSLDQVNTYAYSCSFQPTRYLGLDVRPRTTWQSRVIAVTLAGPPMIALIAVYSILVVPLRRHPASPGKQAAHDLDAHLPRVVVTEDDRSVRSTNGKTVG